MANENITIKANILEVKPINEDGVRLAALKTSKKTFTVEVTEEAAKYIQAGKVHNCTIDIAKAENPDEKDTWILTRASVLPSGGGGKKTDPQTQDNIQFQTATKIAPHIYRLALEFKKDPMEVLQETQKLSLAMFNFIKTREALIKKEEEIEEDENPEV